MVCYRVNVMVIKDLVYHSIFGYSLNLKATIDLKNRKYQNDGETILLREQHDSSIELTPRNNDFTLLENKDQT